MNHFDFNIEILFSENVIGLWCIREEERLLLLHQKSETAIAAYRPHSGAARFSCGWARRLHWLSRLIVMSTMNIWEFQVIRNCIGALVVSGMLLTGCGVEEVDAGATGESTSASAEFKVGQSVDELIVPPAEAGPITYVGDYQFQNAGLCLQPGADTYPRLGACSDAKSRLSVYQMPDLNYMICIRNSFGKGMADLSGAELPLPAYGAICLDRVDENSMRFEGIPFSVKFSKNGGYKIWGAGRAVDKGNGQIGWAIKGSGRLFTNRDNVIVTLNNPVTGTSQTWGIVKYQ